MEEDSASQLFVIAAAIASILMFNVVVKSRQSKDCEAKDPFASTISGSTTLLSNDESVLSREEVEGSIKGYENLFSGSRKKVGTISNEQSITHRKKEYKTMVNSFYDLVTDFYQWGWGQSFHFAPRVKGETFMESIKRFEFKLALMAGLKENVKAIDIGCGVGGPLKNIAHFSGADITGVTLNEYQVKVGNRYIEEAGLDKRCRIVQGDFQNLSKIFEKDAFDSAYAIEAICHSPDRVETFKEVSHILKKGGLFVSADWVVLPDKGFDSSNPDHCRLKEGIEVGNGLPTLVAPADIEKALEEAGFEVIASMDFEGSTQSKYEIPWYATLQGDLSLTGFRMTTAGRMCTHALIWFLETIRIAPKGSTRVSALLNATALDIVEAGEKGIFTPSYITLARKK